MKTALLLLLVASAISLADAAPLPIHANEDSKRMSTDPHPGMIRVETEPGKGHWAGYRVWLDTARALVKNGVHYVWSFSEIDGGKEEQDLSAYDCSLRRYQPLEVAISSPDGSLKVIAQSTFSNDDASWEFAPPRSVLAWELVAICDGTQRAAAIALLGWPEDWQEPTTPGGKALKDAVEKKIGAGSAH